MTPTERTRLERVLFAKTRQQDKDISSGVRRVKYGPSGRHFLTPMALIPDEDLVALVKIYEPPRHAANYGGTRAPKFELGDRVEDIEGERQGTVGHIGSWQGEEYGGYQIKVDRDDGGPRHFIPENSLRHQRSHAPNRHGVYHDTAAQEGDYVIHKHGYSGLYWADRVQRGGTHVKIGPAKGWKTREEAIEGIRKDSRNQDFEAGVIFEQRQDDMAQIGHVNRQHDVSEHAPNARSRFGELPAAPRGGPADEQAATELSLFIENDYELVGKENSRGKAIEKNLLKKIQNGTFDLARSEDLWMYLIEDGAKKYAKEFAQAHEWNKIFSKPTRELVAHEFATTFAEENGAVSDGPDDDDLDQPTIAEIKKAGIITYLDSGQVKAYVEGIDTAGESFHTEGNPENAHMKALLERAKREGLSVKKERW